MYLSTAIELCNYLTCICSCTGRISTAWSLPKTTDRPPRRQWLPSRLPVWDGDCKRQWPRCGGRCGQETADGVHSEAAASPGGGVCEDPVPQHGTAEEDCQGPRPHSAAHSGIHTYARHIHVALWIFDWCVGDKEYAENAGFENTKISIIYVLFLLYNDYNNISRLFITHTRNVYI